MEERFDFEEFEETVVDEKPVEGKKSFVETVKGFGKSVASKAHDVIDDVRRNPEEAAMKAGVVLTAAGAIALTALGINKATEPSRTVYSPEIDENVVLKKKLKNKHKVELDARMKEGETKVEALNNMKLIK